LASAKPDTAGHHLAKNGILMEPLGFTSYDRFINTLAFYNDVHMSEPDGNDVILHYAIYDAVDSLLKAPILERCKRTPRAEVLPVLMKMDIASLPSGQFISALEIWDLDQTV